MYKIVKENKENKNTQERKRYYKKRAGRFGKELDRVSRNNQYNYTS